MHAVACNMHTQVNPYGFVMGYEVSEINRWETEQKKKEDRKIRET